jgi:hypothetical protein
MPQWISFVGGFLAALVAGYVSLRVKQNDFVNEYYKTIVHRRIAAYEALETFILNLKLTTMDENDNGQYQALFANSVDSMHQLMFRVMANGLWLSDEVTAKYRELEVLLYPLTHDDEMIAFGKKHFREVSTIRAELERLLAIDMSGLHNVKKFLRSKNRPEKVQLVMLKKSVH